MEGFDLQNSIGTSELASQAQVKPQSILVRLCKTGSYHGIKPMKLPNGRLIWPADSLERMTKGDKCGGE